MDEYLAHAIKEDDDSIRIQTIMEHSENTANLVKQYGKSLKTSNLCTLMAYLHDAGKFSNAFQTYLQQALNGEFVRRGSVNHASPGAHYVMQFREEDIFDQLTKTIISECIISHHGLRDFITPNGKNEFYRLTQENHEQYMDVYAHVNKEFDKKKIDDLYKKAKQEVQNIYTKINDPIKTEEECMFDINTFIRYVLSILINADREDTRSFMLNLSLPQIKDTDIVWTNAISKLEAILSKFTSKDKLSQEKHKISEECKAFADHKSGVYRLSCPTGSGKTLASLRYALYHAKKHHKKHIFYIAPYKSILTQNSEVIKSVFEEQEVLEHHSDIVPEDKQRYTYLNSNWSTPVIMTTAIQFYQTLFSNNTTSIRRFHQLNDAVIIIDEAQTIPLEMISMFNYMINYLSEICHSTVLLCTATQPLFEQTKRPMRLCTPTDVVSLSSKRIEAFKRVHLVNKCTASGFTIEEYADFIMECWRKHKTVLVIVNTKAEAAQLYERCKQFTKEQELKLDIYHLSTNMCPKHRTDKLTEIIRNTKLEESMICISTNLIEAGVDISFPCVIRSLTGLDSILQAAGRANRYKAVPFGYVYIVNSKSEVVGKIKSVVEGKKVMLNMMHKMQSKEYVDELLLPETIAKYYNQYYFHTNVNMDYLIKKLNGETMIQLWTGDHGGAGEANKQNHDKLPILTSALRSAGENFDIMPQTIGVLVPYAKGKELITMFNSNSVSNTEKYELLKEAQLYMIQVYEYTYQKLVDTGVISFLEFGDMLALKEGYDLEVGLNMNQKLEDLFL